MLRCLNGFCFYLFAYCTGLCQNTKACTCCFCSNFSLIKLMIFAYQLNNDITQSSHRKGKCQTLSGKRKTLNFALMIMQKLYFLVCILFRKSHLHLDWRCRLNICRILRNCSICLLIYNRHCDINRDCILTILFFIAVLIFWTYIIDGNFCCNFFYCFISFIFVYCCSQSGTFDILVNCNTCCILILYYSCCH